MQLSPQQLSDIVAVIRDESSVDLEALNKRRHSRLEVEARVEIAAISREIAPRRYSALTRDISFCGMGIVQAVPVFPDQQIAIRLPLGRGRIVLLRCRIAHARMLAYGLFGVGLEFDGEVGLQFLEQLALASGEEIERIRKSVLG